MSFIELFLISTGLAMDAFAVSIAKGLSMPRLNYKKAIIIALFFGGFQALMPYIGYHLGLSFSGKIAAIDHWIVFLLLGAIGCNMIKESREEGQEVQEESLGVRNLTMLAIATSIDALAIGIGFAFLNVDIIPSILCIGIITFIICIIGVKIGNVFGEKYSAKAEFVGGMILVMIGIKVLLEHLFF